MPTKSPRITIALDRGTYRSIQLLARRDNVSLTAKVRGLLREAIEAQEDAALSGIATEREASWGDEEGLCREDVWS